VVKEAPLGLHPLERAELFPHPAAAALAFAGGSRRSSCAGLALFELLPLFLRHAARHRHVGPKPRLGTQHVDVPSQVAVPLRPEDWRRRRRRHIELFRDDEAISGILNHSIFGAKGRLSKNPFANDAAQPLHTAADGR